MAEIKGVLLTAWIDFLKQHYGESAVNEAIKTLDTEDRLLLMSPFLASSWYSYDTLHVLRRLTRPLATASDTNLAQKIGSFMAEYVFTGVYKSLLAKDPEAQVKKFSWIGEFFFQDARQLETEMTGDACCLVRYRYESGASPTRAICESLTGFWSRTLELAGATNVKAAHPKCLAAGDSVCEFAFDWKHSAATRPLPPIAGPPHAE